MTPSDLFAHQDANRRRSRYLVIMFVAFFAWLGLGADGLLWMMTRDAPAAAYHHRFPLAGLVALAVAGLTARGAWRAGAKRVLRAAGAVELHAAATPDETRLVNVVEEMAIASALPRPRIWIVPDEDPNAFATGLDPTAASVVVTRGLLHRLDRDELQGVVAHEMAHIQNLDVRLMTLLAAMVGAVVLLSDLFRRILRTGRISSGGKRGGKGASPVLVLVLIGWILSVLLAPLLTRLLAMATSRSREFLADATAAQFTRNPLALARALQIVDQVATPTRAIGRGSAHLCIVDPGDRAFSEREGWVGNLFASHPPIGERIRRLQRMGYAPAPAVAETG